MNNLGNISASVPSKALPNDSLNPNEPSEMHQLWLKCFFTLNTSYKLYNTSYCLPLTNAAYGFIIPIETTKNWNLLTSNALVRDPHLRVHEIVTHSLTHLFWNPQNLPQKLALAATFLAHVVECSPLWKSTTGGCQFLGRRLIYWQCKKQTIVATSTTEAEYVAAASCYGKVFADSAELSTDGLNFVSSIETVEDKIPPRKCSGGILEVSDQAKDIQPLGNGTRSRSSMNSGLVLHQMTSDHNRSELGIQDHSNEPSSSKLVPKVVPLAVKTATSRQELELLFHLHIAMLRTTAQEKG
ncbi:hypothetical protein Tco_0780196 [Tanacetum coccineum]